MSVSRRARWGFEPQASPGWGAAPTRLQCPRTGIWTKDIKRRTNLIQLKINKIVTSLQSRNLIKLVKSVQNSNRKVGFHFVVMMVWTRQGGLQCRGGAGDLGDWAAWI